MVPPFLTILLVQVREELNSDIQHIYLNLGVRGDFCLFEDDAKWAHICNLWALAIFFHCKWHTFLQLLERQIDVAFLQIEALVPTKKSSEKTREASRIVQFVPLTVGRMAASSPDSKYLAYPTSLRGRLRKDEEGGKGWILEMTKLPSSTEWSQVERASTWEGEALFRTQRRQQRKSIYILHGVRGGGGGLGEGLIS